MDVADYWYIGYFAVSIVLAYQLYVTLRVTRATEYSRMQKIIQTILIWVLPVLGAVSVMPCCIQRRIDPDLRIRSISKMTLTTAWVFDQGGVEGHTTEMRTQHQKEAEVALMVGTELSVVILAEPTDTLCFR